MAIHATKMANRLAIGLITLIGFSSGWAASSEAAPITFDFTGSYRTRDGFDHSINGSYTFESTAADQNSSSDVGSYLAPSAAPYGFTVTDGGYTAAGSYRLDIAIRNDVNRFDSYSVFGCAGGQGCPGGGITLLLDDFDQAWFDSDALPVTPPPLPHANYSRFFIWEVVNGVGTEVAGTLTSLTCAAGCPPPDPDPGPGPTPVPEPGTLLLLGSGLTLLARRRQSNLRIRPSSPTSTWTSANATR